MKLFKKIRFWLIRKLGGIPKDECQKQYDELYQKYRNVKSELDITLQTKAMFQSLLECGSNYTPFKTCRSIRDQTRTFRQEYHFPRYGIRPLDCEECTIITNLFLKGLMEQDAFKNMVRVVEVGDLETHPDERIIRAEITVTGY